jgi:hypothetical protein
MDTAILTIQILILILLGYLFRSYLPAYFEEKAKNLATKQDVGEITREVESVKAEVSQVARMEETRYRLKYEACLDALSVLDAHLSHSFKNSMGSKIVLQHAFTKDVRECHSKLILSCEDTDILELFSEIIFGPKPGEKPRKPLTDLLNEFRNLVRKELGFGHELLLDRDRAWVGKMACDQNSRDHL